MKRPYVLINCAISSNGRMADRSGKQTRISCEEDIKRMYELRNQSDAVLVGVNTVLSDNPKLTVKEKYVKNPRQPIRIVLDTYCKTPVDSLVVNDAATTYIITDKKCDKTFGKNVEIIICDAKNGLIDLEKFLDVMYKRGIRKLMVEGGGTVIYNFLKAGFVDDFFVYVGPMKIDGGKTPPFVVYDKVDTKNLKLKLIETKNLGLGKVYHYRLIK